MLKYFYENICLTSASTPPWDCHSLSAVVNPKRITLNVITDDNIDILADTKIESQERWDALVMLQRAFPLLNENKLYYLGSDRIASALRELAKL